MYKYITKGVNQMTNRKEYTKAYNQAHKEERKAYNQAHKEEAKAYRLAHKEESKAYYQAHKEEVKAWQQSHKEERKAWREARKEEIKAYIKSDVNSLGQTKQSIRSKSKYILKKMHLNIPGYQIHHCFGYEDASKFIYISKSLHLKIHQYLRDNNIDAGKDHWMAIRDLVNDTDEFIYIRC